MAPEDAETGRLFAAARRAGVVPSGSPGARIAMIHAADAAAQIAALAGRPAEGATWTLADGRPDGYGWDEIRAALGAALGRSLVGAPLGLWLPVAEAASAVQRALGLQPLLAQGKGREMRHADWSVAPAEQAEGTAAVPIRSCVGIADAITSRP